MTVDIFLSYSQEDRERVEPLVRLFEAEGWVVWWDRELVPGAAYEDVIDKAISEASCVVVAWSQTSVNSEWVQAEAGEGFDRHILVPVLLDDVRLPISFRRRHAARLLDWPETSRPHEIRTLLKAIRTCIAGAVLVDQDAFRLRPRPAFQQYLPIAALAVLLGLAGMLYVLVDRDPPAEAEQLLDVPGNSHRSIAVLPFASSGLETVAESQVSFAVANQLNRVPNLLVVSDETANLVIRDLGFDDPAAIGRELGVEFVLFGSTQSVGDAVVIIVSLINTLHSTDVWRKTFSTADDHPLTITQVVASNVAQSLQLSVDELSLKELNEAAYVAYLKGRAELRRPAPNEAGRTAAAQLFRRAMDIEPRFAPAFAGMCLVELGRYQEHLVAQMFGEAERYCQRALALDRNNIEVLVALGRLYRLSGELDQALSTLERALELKPFDVGAMRGLGQVFSDMGLVREAEEKYLTLILIEPTYWRNYRELGNLYYATGQYTQAAEYYRQDAALTPEKSASYLNLGATYFMAGELGGAIEAWEMSIEAVEDPNAYSNLGAAHFFAGDFDQAARMYEKARQMLPNDHAFWGMAAEAYRFSGDSRSDDYYRRAIELVTERLDVNPGDHAALASKACYHAALGEEETATSAIEKALRLNPENVYSWYDAARVYALLGHDESAVGALREALDRGYSRPLVDADANFTSLKHKL